MSAKIISLHKSGSDANHRFVPAAPIDPLLKNGICKEDNMCAHEVDEFGYPADPELRALEFHLCDLAAAWRSSKDDPQRREKLIKDYHATMDKLYSLGWDSELDWECFLPKDLMPEEYVRRNPFSKLTNLHW